MRRSLLQPVEVRGTGLFTGRPAMVRILPGAPGSGIAFRRIDVAGSKPIPAVIGSVAAASSGMPARNTTLSIERGVEVLTVEHVMSALSALGITDGMVEVDGPEIPIGDGSASTFADAIWKAGIRYLGEDVPPLTIAREVTVTGGGGATITATPRAARGCRYAYELDYGPGAGIPSQAAAFDATLVHAPDKVTLHDYLREVAPARTFCTMAEAKAMQAMGLFKDLSPRDMLVIGDRGPVENSYRFENEPARHKLLDLIGDLSLVGRPIQADIVARKAGHALNHAMARALIEAAAG